MGIVFDTDIMGLQQLKVDERGPVPTAAAMLRDVINLTVDGRLVDWYIVTLVMGTFVRC